MKKYTSFLFDADGTIIDTMDLIIKCFGHTLKHFKRTVPSAEVIASHVGMPFQKQILHYFDTINNDQISEIWDFYRRYQLEHYQDYLSLCPGAETALTNLKDQGAKLAIVTSRTRHTLDLYLKFLNIFDFFEVIVTPDDVEHPKPHHESTEQALDLLSSTSDQTLFIGDAIYDNLSASAAGVDFAYVTWSHVPIADFIPKPQYSLSTLKELTPLFKNN